MSDYPEINIAAIRKGDVIRVPLSDDSFVQGVVPSNDLRRDGYAIRFFGGKQGFVPAGPIMLISRTKDER